MHTSAHSRFLLVVMLGILTVSVVAGFYALRLPQATPSIKGVFIPQGRNLDNFVLVDHNHSAFTKDDLRGKWHFVSYGYTFCPDICPITLSILSSLTRRLQDDAFALDTSVLFYSVDPARDTPDRLAQYVTFFNRDFIGLTYGEDSAHIPFEKSLGMVYEIPEVDAEIYGDEYPVNHGVMIYLLNPDGNLQAVFTPEFNDEGMFYFSTDRLYTDYRAIRIYFSD